MSVEDTIRAVHDQGGLAVLAHPFMPTYFASITPAALRRLLGRGPLISRPAPTLQAKPWNLNGDPADRVPAHGVDRPSTRATMSSGGS
jgi:hypothetical protein